MDLTGRLSAFFAALPVEIIDISEPTRETFAQATHPTPGVGVFGVLAPIQTDHIRQILKKASEFKIPIYPVSRGKNWGYGSQVPLQSGVVMSLVKLDQIIATDWERGLVTVQPGVSFRQLQTHLASGTEAWQYSGPGSTQEASVVGNLLERGLTQGPTLERWRKLVSFTVITPAGDTLQTDAHATLNTGLGMPHGPQLAHLFLQSNLGVVVEATFSLDPAPKHWQHLHATWENDMCAWESVIPILRNLQRDQGVTTSLALHNATKILSYSHPSPQYPQRSVEQKKARLSEIQGGDWFVEAAIAGASTAMLEARRTLVEQAFSPLGIHVGWGDINAAGPMYHTHTQPSLAPLYGAQGRVEPANPQPEADMLGVLWHAVVVPYIAKEMHEVVTLVTKSHQGYGIEPMITFQLPNYQYGYLVLSWVYDRNDLEIEEQMLACYNTTVNQLSEHNYLPYRKGWMGHKSSETPGAKLRLLTALRQEMDPSGILAPEHYLP